VQRSSQIVTTNFQHQQRVCTRMQNTLNLFAALETSAPPLPSPSSFGAPNTAHCLRRLAIPDTSHQLLRTLGKLHCVGGDDDVGRRTKTKRRRRETRAVSGLDAARWAAGRLSSPRWHGGWAADAGYDLTEHLHVPGARPITVSISCQFTQRGLQAGRPVLIQSTRN